ncbi:MAG: hypothetical protein K6G65_07925 [Lachnospiraceae bacterium]|nr:hypothetical protein [Lachnospiraceae bacterium]
MIEWANNYYIDDSVKKNPSRWRKRLTRIAEGKHTLFRRTPMDIHVIALTFNDNDLFQIIPAGELSSPLYKGVKLRIVGMAWGKENAKELTGRIVADLYRQTGDIEPKTYFKFGG